MPGGCAGSYFPRAPFPKEPPGFWLLILQAYTPGILAHPPCLVTILLFTRRKEGVSPGLRQSETFSLNKERTHGHHV